MPILKSLLRGHITCGKALMNNVFMNDDTRTEQYKNQHIESERYVRSRESYKPKSEEKPM
ncbi:unnamed protein product [Brugia pahangi]|uniref:Transposase n=1 Tax=Brugia pahangi TaxID=6280 RepID=A0A0N4TR36_BRUPA|nr:unnamed protein product [Brugia pahangi]